MYKSILIFLCLFGFHLTGKSQDSITTRKIELKVLTKMSIGETFPFNVSTKKDERNQIMVKYLGVVKTKNKTIYKVITWARIWGANNHTTGVIVLFDKNNKYFGKYVLGDMADLPDKIASNYLVFTNKNKSNCNKSIVTKISFNNIPQDLFIKCDRDRGDFYSLVTK